MWPRKIGEGSLLFSVAASGSGGGSGDEQIRRLRFRRHRDAFLAGRLQRQTRGRMVEHMATCSTCYAMTASWHHVTAKRPRAGRWIRAAAIAVLILVTVLAYDRWSTSGTRRISILANAAPPMRSFEGRITAFPYRPYGGVFRSAAARPPDRYDTVFIMAADRVHPTSPARSALDFRVIGFSDLVRGNPSRAVEAFESAVKTTAKHDDLTTAIRACNEPALLSDLSAAYLARGRSAGHHSDFVNALDVAIRAWDRERTAETAWNRAIAFEALHQNEEARAAWQEYLVIDSRSQWASEARQRLGHVRAPSQSVLWKRESVRLETMSPAQLRVVANRFPQQLRELGEGELLQRWATSVQNGSITAAASTLQQLEAIGGALRDGSGDTLLADVVISIRRASATERALADTVREFGAAKALYDGEGGSKARAAFARAASDLRRLACPLSFAASFYAAASWYLENDYDRLGRDIACIGYIPSRYMSLNARVHWVMGLAQLAVGRPDEAIQQYEAALTIFAKLGETDYEVATYSLLAEAYGYVDDRDAAWRSWGDAVHALGSVGASSRRGVHVMLRGAEMAIAENQTAAASVFLNQALRHARIVSDRSLVVETILRQTMMACDQPVEYRRLIAFAQSTAETISDPKLRERAMNSVSVTRALCGDRGVATTDLAQSVKFLQASSNRFSLPWVLHLRGKLRAANRNYSSAMSSYADALEEIINQRGDTFSPRFDMLGRQQLDNVTQSAVALAVTHRDYASAFRISEVSAGADLRWRKTINRNSIPSNVAVIKAVTQPDRLVVWLFTDRRATVAQLRVRRTALEAAATALRSNTEDTTAGALLGRLLLEPFGRMFDGMTSIVFIPDAVLTGVPFAAVVHPVTNRKLAHNFAIAEAPTLAAFLESVAVNAPSYDSVVLVDGSVNRDFPRLPQAAAEIRTLRRLYGSAHVLSANDPSAIGLSLGGAGLVHVAAHGVVNRNNPLLSAIVLGSRSSFLYAHQVAGLELKGRPIIVLSSCSGSSASSVRGRRGASMADAFLVAGASAVVAASDDVDDRHARAFSILLHENLRKGLTVGDAVRRTQLSLKSDGRPWAQFRVVGNPLVRLTRAGEGRSVTPN